MDQPEEPRPQGENPESQDAESEFSLRLRLERVQAQLENAQASNAALQSQLDELQRELREQNRTLGRLEAQVERLPELEAELRRLREERDRAPAEPPFWTAGPPEEPDETSLEALGEHFQGVMEELNSKPARKRGGVRGVIRTIEVETRGYVQKGPERAPMTGGEDGETTAETPSFTFGLPKAGQADPNKITNIRFIINAAPRMPGEGDR